MDLIAVSGPIAWGVIVLAAVGVILALVLAGLAAFRMRVPAPIWFVTPFVVMMVGYAGAGLGIANATRALGLASADSLDSLAASAWSAALAPVVLAYLACAGVLLLQAWMGGVGHALRVGTEPRWSAGHAALAFLAGVIVGFFQAIYVGFAYGWTSLLMLLPLALALGAPALAIVTLRISALEAQGDAGRLAAARVTVGMSWTGALLCLAIAANLQGESMLYGAMASAGSESLGALTSAAEALRSGGWAQGFVAVVPALVVTALAGLSESRSLESGRTVGGAIATAAMALILLVVHVVVMSYGKDLVAIVETARAAALAH